MPASNDSATPLTPLGSHSSSTLLHGRRLLLARAVWGVVALIDLAVIVTGLPALAAQLHMLCTDPTRANCTPLQLAPAQLADLQQNGISLADYALYAFGLDVVATVLLVIVGALIFWHKSRERMGLFVSLFLITYGAFGLDGSHLTGPNLDSWLATLAFPLFVLQWPAQGILFYTFPDGHFVPRWSWLLTSLFLIQFGFYVLPYPYNFDNWPPLFNTLESVIVYGSMVGTQVYRYIAVASPIQRQQIKWLAFGYALLLVLFAFLSLLPLVIPALHTLNPLLGPFLLALGYLPISLGIGIALLRYRLWDIDALINRTLVYGVLTALLGAVYAGLIIGLNTLARGLFNQTSGVEIVLSTLIIAALFYPLRRRIQALIDRRFYRRKYDAEKTLAAFSATLRNEVDLNGLREHLLAMVQETMQPAHVSLWLKQPEQGVQEQAQRLEPR
ncbi:MAG TPA: hypothetical protein VH540_07800 [Ktedonobacterales bacterium]|jgi:hypothetical protein